MPYKKVYTVEITGCQGKPQIWYADKVGQWFDCEIVARNQFKKDVVFLVIEMKEVRQYIHPVHCKVVNERIEVVYEK